MCSIILQTIQVNETGRYFLARNFSPFWKIGTTNACFQSLGTSPTFKNFLNNSARIGASSSAHSLEILGRIASGPAAL